MVDADLKGVMAAVMAAMKCLEEVEALAARTGLKPSPVMLEAITAESEALLENFEAFRARVAGAQPRRRAGNTGVQAEAPEAQAEAPEAQAEAPEAQAEAHQMADAENPEPDVAAIVRAVSDAKIVE